MKKLADTGRLENVFGRTLVPSPTPDAPLPHKNVVSAKIIIFRLISKLVFGWTCLYLEYLSLTQ